MVRNYALQISYATIIFVIFLCSDMESLFFLWDSNSDSWITKFRTPDSDSGTEKSGL